MLTAAQRKAITALHRKKGRAEQGKFVVEGPKLVGELLESDLALETIVCTSEWRDAPRAAHLPMVTVPVSVLARVSALETPHQVLAVARIPDPVPPPADVTGLVLALDGIQDPGNLGTLLRIAEWFGATQVVASPECADRFNPKVVQASMGSVLRVPVSVTDLSDWLGRLPSACDIVGAFLDGENLYAQPRSGPAVIVLGREGRGISPDVAAHVRRRVTIPAVGGRAESLNVAAAAALLCAEWRRSDLLGRRL